MADPNYLIGFGQRLARPITLKQGGGPKLYPYSFEQARRRQAPQWNETSKRVDSLPTLACPDDTSVIAVTLHPNFLARSFYPTHLLRDVGLRRVGSRARKISIDQSDKRNKLYQAPQLFVAGRRTNLASFAESLPRWRPPSKATENDFRKIYDVHNLDLTRLKSVPGDDAEPPLEVVLHASEDDNDDFVLDGFEAFVEDLGLEVDINARMHAGGLCFLPMRAPRQMLEALASFSFVRVIRRMPALSLNETILRTSSMPGGFPVELPDAAAINPDVRVASFDGGLPTANPVATWARPLDAVGVGAPTGHFLGHGLAVTSALLFGPLEAGQKAPVPYANVDHWRVLDRNVRGHDFELMDVLRRILDVLQQRKYNFVNLSIGPSLPIEDDDVHVWTSRLDEYTAKSGAVVVSACGNTGADDWDSGNARVQPCSDTVNGVGVGAINTRSEKWRRASYSSIGPGRSPGYIKPDLVAFGGSDDEPFWLLDHNRVGFSAARMGTSYSAPFALRTGIGIQAHFGSQLSATTIKALMLHHCQRGDHTPREVGWGRMPSGVEELVICPDGEVTVLYQGNLEPSQFIRFLIPVPRERFTSDVLIKATFCFFSPIDPEDSLNYTRVGLGPVFRPITTGHPGYNKNGEPRGAHQAAPFFRSAGYSFEETVRRREAHKWETVLKDERRFAPGMLDQPVFDVEHHARAHGAPSGRLPDVPYALIVSLTAKSEANLYNRILAAYPNLLQILRPTIEVQITNKHQ